MMSRPGVRQSASGDDGRPGAPEPCRAGRPKAIVWLSPPTHMWWIHYFFPAAISASWRFAAPSTTWRWAAPGRFICPAPLLSRKASASLVLRHVAHSMASAARAAGVAIVTRRHQSGGARRLRQAFHHHHGHRCDPAGRELGVGRAQIGDHVLVNGMLGDHGAAVLAARGDLALETGLQSDCASLHELIEVLLAAAPGTRFLRDATTGRHRTY